MIVLLNIEVQRTKTGRWFWRFISAKNGKVVATSREYATKQMCFKTATNLYEGIRINRLDLVERDKSSAEECYIVRTLRDRKLEEMKRMELEY